MRRWATAALGESAGWKRFDRLHVQRLQGHLGQTARRGPEQGRPEQAQSGRLFTPRLFAAPHLVLVALQLDRQR